MTKEYVDISYVSYNVTSTPIYNSMGTVHAGSYLTAPSASSAGSLQGHKFRSWRYNNSDVSPGASFKTYPSIKNLYSDWDPIKLQVYHNGNWTSANIYVAHGNILSPPDLIKVFLNGQWVEV